MPHRHYQIISGDTDRFSIDSSTGLITTTTGLGLDYEQSHNYILIVSTQEATTIDPQYTCTVNVTVLVSNNFYSFFFAA